MGLMGARSRGAFTFPEGHAFQGEVLPSSSSIPEAQGMRGNKREEKASDDKVVERFKVSWSECDAAWSVRVADTIACDTAEETAESTQAMKARGAVNVISS